MPAAVNSMEQSLEGSRSGNRQMTLVARGVRSDVEREEARLGPSLSMALTKWGVNITGAVANAYPVSQASAIKSAVSEEALGELQSKLIEVISESFQHLVQATAKTIHESAAAMNRIDDVAPAIESPVAAKPAESDATAPASGASTPPPQPQPPQQATAPSPLQPKHSRRAVKVLVDHGTMTDDALLQQEVLLVSAHAQTTAVVRVVEEEGRGARMRRVFDTIRTRLAALRLTAAVSRAATERLILVKEIIRLMALQKDGAAPLDDAPRKLVAAQLQSWQRGIEQGSLSDATTAMLASLDSGALRVIAARASGEEDTSAAELADALSRPAMRRYPDAPRVRVRVASTGVGVSEADLLAALPVRDDGSSGETFASAREALKSRERARLGERSFFLCRRCGEDARGEYRFDASTKRFLRPPNGAPSSQSVTFVSDPQTARKPAAVPTLPAPPQPPLSARDSREHSAPLSTQQQQQLTPALPEFDPPRQHAASSRSPRGGRSPVAGERHAASAFLPAITPRARKPAAFESQFFGPAARPQDESKRLAATVDWAAPTSLMHSTKAGETAVSGPARTTPRHTAAPPGPSATGAA